MMPNTKESGSTELVEIQANRLRELLGAEAERDALREALEDAHILLRNAEQGRRAAQDEAFRRGDEIERLRVAVKLLREWDEYGLRQIEATKRGLYERTTAMLERLE
jgi:hypothetical protein